MTGVNAVRVSRVEQHLENLLAQLAGKVDEAGGAGEYGDLVLSVLSHAAGEPAVIKSQIRAVAKWRLFLGMLSLQEARQCATNRNAVHPNPPFLNRNHMSCKQHTGF